MPWFVAYTKPNSEKKIAEALANRGVNIYCPTYVEMRQWSDRKKKVTIPLFRSYLFVNLADYQSESSQILALPGVIKFVWWQGKPGIVKENEINEIKAFLNDNKNNKISIEYQFNAGDKVNIVTGPLSGQTGTFVEQRGKKAVLELSSLNCRLVAHILVNNIELKPTFNHVIG